jgi:hypothetical protein
VDYPAWFHASDRQGTDTEEQEAQEVKRWPFVLGASVVAIIAIGAVSTSNGDTTSSSSTVATPMHTTSPTPPTAATPVPIPKPTIRLPVVIKPPTGVNRESHLVGVLNPDVTQATIGNTICVRGWTAIIRPPSSYTTELKISQLPADANPSDYEEDHLMPLELGGAPMDPRNLHPVRWMQARADDKQENRLHRLVCAGSMTLMKAQIEMSAVKYGEDR